MRWLGVLFLALAFALSARAEDWTTEDGKTYKNVTVLNQEDDGVRITYAGGVGKIPYYELPVDIQKRFGQDIDSLAAKKKAVDQAMDDAVRNAIAAEQVKQKETSPGVSPPNPGITANPPATPSPGGDQGTSANNGANPSNPGGPGTPTGPAKNVPPGNGIASTTAAPGAHGAPGTPGSGPHSGGNGALPGGLNDYTPGSGGAAAAAPYAGSKVTYNQALDLSYLDSPPIDLVPVDAPGAKPRKQNASLTLRVVSEGQKPAAPEKIEVTYLCVGGTSRSDANSAIEFRVDGKSIGIADSARKDSSSMGGGAQSLFYLTFYLAPEELKTISAGKDVQVSVSPELYKLDATGMSSLQSYQKDLDLLPKPASSILRSYYKLLAKIPSFVSMISTACEYLILGSFALLVCASIAAFIMGVTRFIKM